MIISGTSSGLGQYLSEQMLSTPFKRDEPTNLLQQETIIHCAWGQDVSNPEQYVTNAINLAKELIKIPHEQFIFISSIDVYPKNDKLWTEYDEIDIRDVCGIYGVTKLIVEDIVLKTATNPLIIRPSILLGPYTRGAIKTIATSLQPEIRTSTSSDYNLVLYSDLLDFIKYSYGKLTGIFNFTSRKNVKLHELIKFPKQDNKFIYKAGDISNMKSALFVPNLNKTSHEIYNIWKKEYYF